MIDYKALTQDQIDHVLSSWKLPTKPRWHQGVGLVFGLPSERVAYWYDIGTGKSLLGSYLAMLWGCSRILVVCPPSVVRTWQQEVKKHTDMPAYMLRGPKSKRRAILDKHVDGVFVVNYEGLLVLWSKRVGKGKGRMVRLVDADRVAADVFDCIVFDESHHLSNPETMRWQVAHALAVLAPNVVMLTGSPYRKSLLDLWGQYAILDQGKTLGSDFHEFRSKYFVQRKDPYVRYVQRQGASKAILERVAPTTLRFDLKECFELPPVVRQRRYVSLSEEQERLTEALLEGMEPEIQRGGISVANIFARAHKLAQIVGGAIKTRDGWRYLTDVPKLTEMTDILEEVGREQVIVYHRYVGEGKLIESHLDQAGISHASLRGEVQNKQKQIDRFVKGEARVLVAHPKSGGEGLNLQQCRVVTRYSQMYDGAVTRPQTEGRVYRLGQKRTCLFLDLIAEGSIDERIYDKALNRNQMAKAVLNFVRDFRKRRKRLGFFDD